MLGKWISEVRGEVGSLAVDGGGGGVGWAGLLSERPAGVGGGEKSCWNTYTDPASIPRADTEKMRPPSLALPPGQPTPFCSQERQAHQPQEVAEIH